MSKFTLILPLVAMTACSQSALIEKAYGDRERFTFYSEGLEENSTYLCEMGATAAETKSRAKKAHVFVEQNLEYHVTAATEKLINNDDPGMGDFVSFSTYMRQASETIALKMEEKYKCVLIG
jgi:hypothetical protein